RELEDRLHRRADALIGRVAMNNHAATDVGQRAIGRSIVDHEKIVVTLGGMARQGSANLLALVVGEGGGENLHTSTAAPFWRIDASIAAIARVMPQLKRASVSGARDAAMASTNSRHWFLSGSLGCTRGLTMSPSRTRSLNSPYESATASWAATPRSK